MGGQIVAVVIRVITKSLTPRMKGYTLIEILVVLVITAIVFSGGYAAYREFNRRAAIDAAAKGLISDLRLAQEKALSADKPETCTQEFEGYRFTLVSSTHYRLEAVCRDTSEIIKEVDTPAIINLSMSPTNSVTFQSVGRGTNITTGSKVSIVITRVGITKSQTISIGSGGEITRE